MPPLINLVPFSLFLMSSCLVCTLLYAQSLRARNKTLEGNCSALIEENIDLMHERREHQQEKARFLNEEKEIARLRRENQRLRLFHGVRCYPAVEDSCGSTLDACDTPSTLRDSHEEDCEEDCAEDELTHRIYAAAEQATS